MRLASSQTLIEVLRAAGEGTRLRLLSLLNDGEHSVKDLTEILGQSQPRVSRHLKLLADAGLVTRNAEGAWAYYGLSPNGAGGDLARWLIGKLEADDPDRIRDLKRLEAVRASQQQQAAAYFAKVADSWDLLRTLHVPEVGQLLQVLRALEHQVLEEVGEAGAALRLAAHPHVVVDGHGDDGAGAVGQHEDAQPVAEPPALDGERGAGGSRRGLGRHEAER